MALLPAFNLAFSPAARPLAKTPSARPYMSAAGDDASLLPTPNTGPAAKELRKMLDEERQKMINTLFETKPDDEAYLDERPALVGQITSSELLTRDEQAGMWPPELSTDRSEHAMLWVDEYTCIGCRWCACVARSTFQVKDDDYGTAQVVDQGGDAADVVEEAIDVCPADCIHLTSRDDLEVLEEYRELYQNDLMAKFYHHSRLGGEGGGGGAAAVPHWRDPLVNRGWMQGEQYVKTSRLKANLDDVLLHKSGHATNPDATAASQPAVFPATGRNWPRRPTEGAAAEE